MPNNFCFVVDSVLAGMERPGTFVPLRNDLEFLRSRGIGAIVSLTARPLPRKLLREFNLLGLHLPVADFAPPAREQVDRFAAFLQALETKRIPVVVHCGAGLGRTGTMLACALIFRGLSPQHAVDKVRALRPYSIETREQEEFVREYAEVLRRRREEGIPLCGEAESVAGAETGTENNGGADETVGDGNAEAAEASA